MSVLRLFFGWPAGGVWSNLVASAVCSLVVWWRLHRQALLQHAEQLALAARHHKELLAQAAAHHQELRAHVSQQVADVKGHVSAVADAQASAGAGSNPAAAGLEADERVVPPAATTPASRGRRR